MDSSYNSGGQNIPGAKPGVITSGPETTGVEPNRSKKFSKGDFVANISGSGQPRKSPKKGLIIGGLIVLVLVIGVVAAVVMMGNNKGSSNSNNTPVPAPDDGGETAEITDSDYKYTGADKEFYRYANYILYGDENVSKNLDLGTYNADVNYMIYEAASKDDADFLKRAAVLWKEFYAMVKISIKDYNDNNPNSGTDNAGTAEESENKMVTLEKQVELQNVLMDFVEKYAAMSARTEDGMWKLYKEVGLETAVTTVKEGYAALAQTTYEPGVKWANAKSDQSEMALRLYAMYDSLGCIKDDNYDQSCIDKNLGTLSDAMRKYTNAKSAAEATGVTLDDAFIGVVKNCFEIRDLLGAIAKESNTNSDSNSNSSSDTNTNSDNNSSNTNTNGSSANDRSVDNA